MKTVKSIVLALSLLFGATAAATNLWHTSTIKLIYPYAGGNRFVLGFQTDHPNCTSAHSPNYYYVNTGVNGVTPEDVKAFYALAMLAMSQSLQVSFVFDDATSQCYISAIKADL